MLHDAVLAIIPRDRLPDVLTAIHRAGLGPQARVLDPARGDITGQLLRAGLVDPPSLAPEPERETILVVFTAGRMRTALDAIGRCGGREVQTLARRTSLVLPASPSRTHPPRPYRRPLRPLPRQLRVAEHPES